MIFPPLDLETGEQDRHGWEHPDGLTYDEIYDLIEGRRGRIGRGLARSARRVAVGEAIWRAHPADDAVIVRKLTIVVIDLVLAGEHRRVHAGGRRVDAAGPVAVM